MKKPIFFSLILCFLTFLCRGARAEEVFLWQECLAEAKKNHPDLVSAVESTNQKKSNKTIAASGLFPQIDANLSGSTAKTSAAGTSATADSYTYDLSGTQLIFDGFKTLNNVHSAAEDIKASQDSYLFTSSQVRLNLHTAFINLLKAQELIKVTEEIIKIRRDNLQLIALGYESGLEHKGALLTAEASLAEANFELAQAKRDISQYQRQLTKEMGRQEFKPMSVKGDFTVRDAALEKPDLEALAKSHPSLLKALATRNAAAFDIKSAYADFYPALSGSAGANKKSAHWPPKDDNWNLGLEVTLPVFEGGRRLGAHHHFCRVDSEGFFVFRNPGYRLFLNHGDIVRALAGAESRPA
ncbi:MAG: TolC family protein [Candidatus Omnitrophica bacterium]|nr:TolC family protein [Candidatus Omnitrophota bacterium]